MRELKVNFYTNNMINTVIKPNKLYQKEEKIFYIM
jgi:hypothetical protein